MFNESDDEEMMDLLKVAISPLSVTVERSSEAEEARLGSSDNVDGVRWTLPSLKSVHRL